MRPAIPDLDRPLIVRQQPDIYVFDLWTPFVCRRILAHTDEAASDFAPPNTMNRYGALLANIGLEGLAADLLDECVAPLARRFYPDVGRMHGTHAFLVDYSMDTQRSLAPHADDSDVTLNVCLGRTFEGGDLVFSDGSQKPLHHAVGQAVLHRGTAEHRATRLRAGHRTNLILWCRRKRYA